MGAAMKDSELDAMGGKSTRNRVGRPRANPRPLDHAPEEEILLVAAELFSKKGFAGTSTREIAEAAGLRQPSLFHYYPKKERILEALLKRVGAWATQTVEAVAALPVPADTKLYRLVYDDVHGMCAAPYPISAILQLPEVRPPSFPDFWAKHEQLLGLSQQLIEQGIRDGALSCDDVELAAVALQGMTNSALSWRPPGPALTAKETAAQVANLNLRTLLRDPTRLPSIRVQALALQVRDTSASLRPSA